jgi:prepilin-type N-terminal cleavage/methylation domain-containing protein
MINKTQLKKGFSLIETIVVIAVVAILVMGAYLLSTSDRTNPEPKTTAMSTPTPKSQILPTSKDQPSPITSRELKTYINESIPNLLIRYDDTWTLSESENEIQLEKNNVTITWSFNPFTMAGFVPKCYKELDFVSLPNKWARMKVSESEYNYRDYLITKDNDPEEFLNLSTAAGIGLNIEFIACGIDGWYVEYIDPNPEIVGAFASIVVTSNTVISQEMLSEIDSIAVGSLTDRQ